MSSDDKFLLEEKLKGLFPGQFMRLTEPWDQSNWSKCYKAEFIDRDVLYLKGTPRNRLEAQITSILHGYHPNHIPTVLDEDLVPENQWHWFLLEDAGICNHDRITPECAINAAFHLGRIQNTVCHDDYLAKNLPRCRADWLQEAVSEVYGWALQSVSTEKQKDFLSLQARLVESTSFYNALQKKLTRLPSSCVHGDFWSGNIACREDEVRFIDWGDTLWGVGGISIVNLIDTDSNELSSHADRIWEAYARGWEKDITEDFIQGSRVAALIGSLVIDMEIAKSCGGSVEMLPGMFPGLQILANLCE
jgi:hypothetical protein